MNITVRPGCGTRQGGRGMKIRACFVDGQRLRSRLTRTFDPASLSLRQIVFVAVILSAMSSLVSAQSITAIPDPWGFGLAQPQLSGDGLVVVGRDNSIYAFRWSAGIGTVSVGNLGGGSAFARAVNFDGSVIVGNSPGGAGSQNKAFRWTSEDGMVSLGTLGSIVSYGYGVSGDGSVVTGYSATAAGAYRAFRWTSAGGMEGIGDQPLYPQGISADGNVIVGYLVSGNSRAFRWTSIGGLQDLGTLVGANSSIANATSADGSVVVGQSNLLSGGFSVAFRWTREGGMQSVANHPSSAIDVNEDGTKVVGSMNNRAFLWTPTLGAVDLNTYFPTRCLNTTGWSLAQATGISSDGLTMCGTGTHNNKPVVWIASLLKFVQQPASSAPCSTGSATFSAPAVGAALSYQWQWRHSGTVDWNDVADGLNLNTESGLPAFSASGSQTATLIRLPCEGCPSDPSNSASEFRCLVSNACETITSNAANFTACVADLTCDGQVDDSDFVPFAAAYNTLDCADPAMPLDCLSDLNQDGFVDDSDFVIFAAAYNQLSCN
ncbi:MAG: hypothetical protein JNK16_13225 [Phycisphaerales bacterium]|nr:hypothetical protein [Phycisphaerales bacterium]